MPTRPAHLPTRTATLMAGLLVLASCEQGLVTDPGDTTPPLLIIEAPARGAVISGEPNVIVRGVVTDESGIDTVFVGDQPVTVAADGRFAATVELIPGVTVLDVVARDMNGQEATEQRAVMAGNWSSKMEPIQDALVVFAGATAFENLQTKINKRIDATDLNALAISRNPMVDAGGCLFGYGASVETNLRSLSTSSIDVKMTPVDGGVELVVEVLNVHSATDVDYVISFGDSCRPERSQSTLDIGLIRIRAIANFGLEGENVTFSLDGVEVTIQGFDLGVGGIPGVVLDLFADKIDKLVAGLIASLIESQAGATLQPYLDQLNGKVWQVPVLGMATQIQLRPTELRVTPEGFLARSAISLSFPSLGDVDYVVTQTTSPNAAALASTDAVRLGMADDVGNLMMAALWAHGALDQTIEIPADRPINEFLGFEKIELEMKLPPMIKADPATGTATIVVGDLLVRILGAGGRVLERLSVSTRVDLKISMAPDGKIGLYIDDLQIWLAGLDEFGNTAQTAPIPEAIQDVVLQEVNKAIETALGTAPAPELSEFAALSSLGVSGGYLLVGGELSAEASP